MSVGNIKYHRRTESGYDAKKKHGKSKREIFELGFRVGFSSKDVVGRFSRDGYQ